MSTRLRRLHQATQGRQKQAVGGMSWQAPGEQADIGAPPKPPAPKPTAANPPAANPPAASPAISWMGGRSGNPSNYQLPRASAHLRQQAGTGYLARAGDMAAGAGNGVIGSAYSVIGDGLSTAGRLSDRVGLTRNGEAFGRGFRQYGDDLANAGRTTMRAGWEGVEPNQYAHYTAATMPQQQLRSLIRQQQANGSPGWGPHSLENQRATTVGEVSKNMGPWAGAAHYGVSHAGDAAMRMAPTLAAGAGVGGLAGAAGIGAASTGAMGLIGKAIPYARGLTNFAGAEEAMSPAYEMLRQPNAVTPDQAIDPGNADARTNQLNQLNETMAGWPDEVSNAFAEHPDMPQVSMLLQQAPEQAVELGNQALSEIQQRLVDTPEGQAEAQSVAETGDLSPQGRDEVLNNLSQGWSFEQAMQAYEQMDPMSKLGLWAGGSVAVMGLLNSLLGNGGIGPLLVSLLGAGVAGYAAHQGGMFGGGAGGPEVTSPAAGGDTESPAAAVTPDAASQDAASQAADPAAASAGPAMPSDPKQVGQAFEVLEGMPQGAGDQIIQTILQSQLDTDPGLRSQLDQALQYRNGMFRDQVYGRMNAELGVTPEQADRILDVYARIRT